ncbi:MAG: copper resistance protein NlpE [Deltaproteobacteria bacterium]|jgi:hypothetical protein|nr:copper resistance protein NlpE [Deltaproteobacteria bacterium]
MLKNLAKTLAQSLTLAVTVGALALGLDGFGVSANADNLTLATGIAWVEPQEIAGTLEGQILTAQVQANQIPPTQVQPSHVQATQIQGAQLQLAQARLTATDFVGFYETRMPAASSPGRIIKLWLRDNGQARMTTDYMEGDPLIVDNGNWRFIRNQQRVVVNLPDESLFFELSDGRLNLVDYDIRVYGINGLSFKKIR